MQCMYMIYYCPPHSLVHSMHVIQYYVVAFVYSVVAQAAQLVGTTLIL